MFLSFEKLYFQTLMQKFNRPTTPLKPCYELSCISIKVFCFSCLCILLKRNFSITFRKIEAFKKNTFNPCKTFPEIVPVISSKSDKTQRSKETYKTEKSKRSQCKSSASNDIFYHRRVFEFFFIQPPFNIMNFM